MLHTEAWLFQSCSTYTANMGGRGGNSGGSVPLVRIHELWYSSCLDDGCFILQTPALDLSYLASCFT